MTISAETLDLIRKFAVKNAVDYGSARMDNVLGKVVRSVPKDQVDELKLEVNRIIGEVNSLPKEKLLEEYRTHEREFEEAQEKKAEATSKPRMVLEGAVSGGFATRFPPEPSGYMHIGHANAAFLAQEFARIYNGKAFLYFDDTNPEKERQEFVDAFRKDLDWLGIRFDKEYYASDSMEKLYGYARELINSGNAYACECDGERTKDYRFRGVECEHRKASASDNMAKFEMMLANRYDEERISIRLNGDMKSQNTALRDPTLLRVKRSPHYRQGTKYVVWPTYDFNTPINDSINGVTDAIRTNEFALRDALYYMILDLLRLRKPRLHLHARLPVKGNITGKRALNKLIADGDIKGYDDPRLTTIIALRRRGIQQEAIKKFVLSVGMSRVDTNMDISKLLTDNKRIIDPTSKRLYYVPGPVDIEVKDFVGKEVELSFHPGKNLGSRKYTVGNRFYISGTDASELKEDEIIKLKELFSIRMNKGEDSWIGEIVKDDVDKRLQWVCDGNYVNCSILVPEEPLDDEGNFRKESLLTNNGYIESYAKELKEHEIVQLERFGFCILDNKEQMQFIFISK